MCYKNMHALIKKFIRTDSLSVSISKLSYQYFKISPLGGMKANQVETAALED